MKTIKSAAKSVVRAVKKVASSKVGKALLIGAAVFTGGAALGLWNAPGVLSGINGAFVGGSKAAGAAVNAAANTAAGSGYAAGSTLLPGAGVLAPGAGGGAIAAKTAGQAFVSNLMNTVIGGAAQTAPIEKTGVISKMMGQVWDATKTVASVIDKTARAHPAITQAALTGVASAMSPDEIDILHEKQNIAQQQASLDRARQAKNLDLAGVNTGNTLSSALLPLKYASNGQQIYSGGVMSRRG